MISLLEPSPVTVLQLRFPYKSLKFTYRNSVQNYGLHAYDAGQWCHPRRQRCEWETSAAEVLSEREEWYPRNSTVQHQPGSTCWGFGSSNLWRQILPWCSVLPREIWVSKSLMNRLRKDSLMRQPQPDTSHKKFDNNIVTTKCYYKMSLQIVTRDCYIKSEQKKLHFWCFYLFSSWYTF